MKNVNIFFGISKYSVFDVVQYVLSHERSARRAVNKIRLQKLLYFIQCQFIANHDVVCFSENFVIDMSGTFIPCVKEKYLYEAYLPILPERGYSPTSSCITKKDKEIIDEILDIMSVYTTRVLIYICTSQFKPEETQYTITSKDIRNCFK